MSPNTSRKLLTYAREGIDWDNVLNHLIQTEPELVAKAVEDVSEGDWKVQTRRYAAEGNGKVPVIRYLRELTGLGLKEAKDWVEENCVEFQRNY